MGLPNLNTNLNLVCDNGASFQGFIFDGTNNNPSMSIVQGANTLVDFSLLSVMMPASQYTTQTYTVPANGSVVVNMDSVLIDGALQFLGLVVVYPSTDINKIVIDTEQKFINFQYPAMGAGTFNIGQIMILTGTTLAGAGWELGTSPGEITLLNPHQTFDVTVRILAFN
jgi:hypothetical protein